MQPPLVTRKARARAVDEVDRRSIEMEIDFKREPLLQGALWKCVDSRVNTQIVFRQIAIAERPA